MMWTSCQAVCFGLAISMGFLAVVGSRAVAEPPVAVAGTWGQSSALVSFVRQYCFECHQGSEPEGGLSLQATIEASAIDTPTWEHVVRRLKARQMPPTESQRPTEDEYRQVLALLETGLDELYFRQPDVPPTDALRRLTRLEYRNAIRDLLSVEIDVEDLLPPDEASHGFDNITVGTLSPTLLQRYVTAAEKISRMAVGQANVGSLGETIRLRPDVTQEEHVEGLPLGTRGGTLIDFVFPVDGEYEIQVRLSRDRNEHVEGLGGVHHLEILLDRARMDLLKVGTPDGSNHETVDAHLKSRFRIAAGRHQLGVTFLKQPSSLMETKRQPYQAHYNMHRHPRLSPAVYQVTITGPFGDIATGETDSRRRLSLVRPIAAEDEAVAARQLLRPLVRLAFRRPVTDADLRVAMGFFEQGRREGGHFDAGVQAAISSILVNPHFLFRVESDPEAAAEGKASRLTEFELASRLSFFLWSSLPDDELLEKAEQGKLSDPAVLSGQVDRMLKDPRSSSLVENFAGQWFYLRNLESLTPDLRLFPDFDDNLRQAFRRETELFFESILREDRPVIELLRADYTFLNERLAKHYGIPHLYGSHYRRVALSPDDHRGGLLRHGSILMATSYATRTSPVIRGHWILKNILGVAPPPPPPNVPALKEGANLADLPLRQRLAEHRANEVCASCHRLMDPVGFALENYDAIGRWREVDAGEPLDVSGELPDGSTFRGIEELERALLVRPELFVGTMVEKLMTFAMGRGIDWQDAPAVRKVVREAEADGYRFSSLIRGIVASPPFQMRTSP